MYSFADIICLVLFHENLWIMASLQFLGIWACRDWVLILPVGSCVISLLIFVPLFLLLTDAWGHKV